MREVNNMNYVDLEVSEYMNQFEISKYIKEFKNDNKKELVEEVQKIIRNKKKIQLRAMLYVFRGHGVDETRTPGVRSKR